jgi:hypothetical protein
MTAADTEGTKQCGVNREGRTKVQHWIFVIEQIVLYLYFCNFLTISFMQSLYKIYREVLEWSGAQLHV